MREERNYQWLGIMQSLLTKVKPRLLNVNALLMILLWTHIENKKSFGIYTKRQ